jgi:hypothetical protein
MASAKLSEPTVYKNWALSLLPDPKPPDIDLLEDSKELLLLHVFEALRPGALDWKRIDQKPGNFYKKLSNLTLLFEAMREEGIVVLSVRAADILEGKVSALFAVLWNFMRIYFQERVSKTKEVDESALVEWANNFKSPVWRLAPDDPDEVIGGSDKDFFYGHSMDEGSGVLRVGEWKVPEGKEIGGSSEEGEEPTAAFGVSQPYGIGEVQRRDQPVFPLERAHKKVEPDIFELVDMNFLSQDKPIATSLDELKARQSLLNISNLFGNLPTKIDFSGASEVPNDLPPHPNTQEFETRSPVDIPTDADSTDGLTLVDQVIRRLTARGRLSHDWSARFATKARLDKEIKHFITQNQPKEPGSPPTSSDFDLTTLLSQVKTDTTSQNLVAKAKSLSQKPELPALLQRISVRFSKPPPPSTYPLDFSFGKDYRKVLYQTLKSDYSSRASIDDLRATAVAAFTATKPPTKDPPASKHN